MKKFFAFCSKIFANIYSKKEKSVSTNSSLSTRNRESSLSSVNSDTSSKSQTNPQINPQLVHDLVKTLAARPKIFASAANTFNAVKEAKYLSGAKAFGKTILKTGKDFIKIPNTVRKLSNNLGEGNFITGILENGLLYELANIESTQAQAICSQVIVSPGFITQKEKIGILQQFSNEELITFANLSIAFIDTIKTDKSTLEKIGNTLANIVYTNEYIDKVTKDVNKNYTEADTQRRSIFLYNREKERNKAVFSLIGDSLQAISNPTSIEAFLQITEKLVESLDSKPLDPIKSNAIETIKFYENKIKELSKTTRSDPAYVESRERIHLCIQLREETIKTHDINIIDNSQFLVQKKLKIPSGDLKKLFKSNKQELSFLASEMIKYPDEKNALIDAAVAYNNSASSKEPEKLISMIDAGINLAKHDGFIKSISDAGTLVNFTNSVLALPRMKERTTKLQKLFKGNIENLYEIINHNSADVIKGLTSLGNFSDYGGAKQLIDLSVKAQKESLPLKRILKEAIDIYAQHPESMPKITEQLIRNKKLIAKKIDHALDKMDNNAAKGAIGWLKLANLKGEFFANLLIKVNNPQDLKAISECLEKPKLDDALNILIKHGSIPVSLAAKAISAANTIYKTTNSAIKTLGSYIYPAAQGNTNLPNNSPSSQKQISL